MSTKILVDDFREAAWEWDGKDPALWKEIKKDLEAAEAS